ncbi:MAG: Ig-like domain-containing protein, partial [Candidatus Cloacimonadaceae bacterium]|nr:Ig-like domain-containing protein [Candidatus Cloacimonadaceae bacterium]
LTEEEGTDSFTISNTGSQPLNYSLDLQELRFLGITSQRDRSIAGSTLSVDAPDYISGSTVDWTFSAYNASTDNEWLEDIYIEFPAGITVNSATNFSGGTGGDMTPDLTSGNGITIHWHGQSGDWGVIYPAETGIATVNVSIAPGFSGPINLAYQINGDVYGAEPHILNGNISIPQNIPPISWFSANPMSGSINAGLNQTVMGYFSAIDMEPGIYEALITVNSNDPVHPQMQVQVMMEVTASNTPPTIALPDSFDFDMNETLAVDFSPFVDDVDADPLTLSVSGNTSIQVIIDGMDVSFSAPANWHGSEILIFTVNDGTADSSDDVIVYVNFVNTPPTIVLPDSFAFDMNGSLMVDFSLFVNDVDSDPLTLDYSGNSNISIAIDGMNVTFTAAADWFGSEELTFTVNDGTDDSSDNVTVNVILSYLATPEISSIESTPTGVVLTWQPVANAQNYKIYRSFTPEGTYSFILATTQTSFEDVTDGASAFYKVIAVHDHPGRD